jgi:hypothetical protein
MQILLIQAFLEPDIRRQYRNPRKKTESTNKLKQYKTKMLLGASGFGFRM